MSQLQTAPLKARQPTMPPPGQVEPSPRWIRVKFGDTFVADTRRAQLLIQYGPGRLPTYYFPEADVRLDLLEPAGGHPRENGVEVRTLKVGDRAAEGAAQVYQAPPPELASLKGHIAFDWDKMDAWYEEEEEVFVHARDPHKRVDVMPSSRHVRVVIGGQTVADSRRPHVLFETSLPARYYLPPEDVRLDLLEPTSLTTRCPYKGVASYWSVKVGDAVAENLVWAYPDPIAECRKIKDLMCFFNERVDLYVDGALEARPQTPWSR